MNESRFHLRVFQVLSITLFTFLCCFMVFVIVKANTRQSGKTGQDTAEMMRIRSELAEKEEITQK